MGPCASHPIDSTIRAQGPRWKSIAALLVGGDTGWSDGLLHAVRSRVRLLRRLQAQPAPFQTQHPKRDPCPFQTLRPEAHWRAWIDASSDRAPPKRCAPRRDPCPPPPNIASSDAAFPQMSPAARCRPCPLPDVVHTPPDAVHAPFQAPHVSSLCDWLSKMCGVYRRSGRMREFQLFAIWGFTLAVSSLHNSGQINPTHFQFGPGFPLV